MNDVGRLRKAYYSSITSVVYQVSSIICGLILPRLILNAYGSTYNGVISSITQFLGLISVLQAGVQGATRVSLYKTLSVNDYESTSSIMVANERYYRKISYVLMGYIVLLSLIFPLIIDDNISKKDIVLLVLIIGASNVVQYFFGNAYKALLSADQASYILNILQTITLVLNTIISAVIILAGGSILFAKLGSGLVYALNPIFLYVYVRRHYKLNKKATPDKQALKGRWDVLANSIANTVHENVDIFAITIFCKAAEVSVYTVYNLVSSGLTRLMQVFTSGIEAAFGNMWAKQQIEILKVNFRKYEFLIFAVADILSGCMMVLILPFIRIYTQGIDDVEYIRPLFAILLTATLTTMCIRIPYVTLVQAVGHYKQTKVGSFVEAGLNLVLTFVLIQFYGIVGAVIGTVVANLFRSFQYGFYVSKHLINRNFVVVIKRCIWLLGTIISSVLLSCITISFIDISNWIMWILAACLCFCIHIIILIFSSCIFYRNDFKTVLKSGISLIKGKHKHK